MQVQVRQQRTDHHTELANADHIIDVTVHTAGQAHATLEPPVCLVAPGLRRWRAWVPTQRPQSAQRIIAAIAGIEPGDVALEVPRLGGGFGRKSMSDFVAETAMIAKRVRRPVQLFWTRSDDLRHDYFRPPTTQRVRVGLSNAGGIRAWHHQSVFCTIGTAFDPSADRVAAWELSQGASSLPYETASIRVEGSHSPVPFRVGWVRGVHHVAHAFAVNIAMDMAARSAGVEPPQWHRQCLGLRDRVEVDTGEPREPVSLDARRLRQLIELVRERSAWAREDAGTGRGFAMLASYRTPVACIARVRVESDRRITILGIWVAVDCGRLLYPSGARAQVEGAVVEALGIAMVQSVPVSGGHVALSGFGDYRLPAATEIPLIDVSFLPGDGPPTGVGEVAVAPVAPAIANAIFDAIGERHLELPLLDPAGRLREAGLNR